MMVTPWFGNGVGPLPVCNHPRGNAQFAGGWEFSSWPSRCQVFSLPMCLLWRTLAEQTKVSNVLTNRILRTNDSKAQSSSRALTSFHNPKGVLVFAEHSARVVQLQ